MTAYRDPFTEEVLCADCQRPGRRVFVGSLPAFGHSVTRRNGDHHPFRVPPTPKSEQRASRSAAPSPTPQVTANGGQVASASD